MSILSQPTCLRGGTAGVALLLKTGFISFQVVTSCHAVVISAVRNPESLCILWMNSGIGFPDRAG